MWKFIVDVVHDLRSSLRPDIGRGLFFYMSPICSCYTKTGLDPFHCQVIILHLFNFHFIIIVQICNWKSLRCTIYKKFELIQTNQFFFQKMFSCCTCNNGKWHTYFCMHHISLNLIPDAFFSTSDNGTHMICLPAMFTSFWNWFSFSCNHCATMQVSEHLGRAGEYILMQL